MPDFGHSGFVTGLLVTLTTDIANFQNQITVAQFLVLTMSKFRHRIHRFAMNNAMGECNTILSAYTLYRHLG